LGRDTRRATSLIQSGIRAATAITFFLDFAATIRQRFRMILTWLTKYRDFGLLLLRVGLGGMFVVVHGWPKISGGPHLWKEIGGAMRNLGVHFTPEAWGFLAALAEFGGGILLILGLLFRPACGALTFTMAVAATMLYKMHGSISEAAQPIELGIVFLALLFIGPGRYSLDKN
jgi:putative oxidoreductase